ncbi:hypothetical protein [Kitasatospora griseola]|uniref:hypothetical protein n=1 Tax=Kitasatospora griseola TaxID=2064 RepID=UPI000A6E1484|nr:hypothetical protein [Kitasatospora griseola]
MINSGTLAGCSGERRTSTARAGAFGASLTTGPTPPDRWTLDLKTSSAGHRPNKE